MASRLYIKIFRTSATSAEYPKIRLIEVKKARYMFEYHPSSQHLAGKKILITGASDGIGRVNAICFAEHGAELLLLGRNQEKLEQLFDEIEENPRARSQFIRWISPRQEPRTTQASQTL